MNTNTFEVGAKVRMSNNARNANGMHVFGYVMDPATAGPHTHPELAELYPVPLADSKGLFLTWHSSVGLQRVA